MEKDKLLKAIVGIVGTTVVTYASKRKIDKINLKNKYYNIPDISSIIIPEDVYSNEEKYDRQFKKIINKYIEIINKLVNKDNLGIMYKNLKTLKFNHTLFIYNLLNFTKHAGLYNPDNTITISKSNKLCISDLFHELNHMASTIVTEDYLFSGFSQENNKVIIGEAINEGYTELMTDRQCGKANIEFGLEYYQFYLIAKKIEDIVGYERMSSLYYRANLKGLIEELSKYASVDETLLFIKNTDILFYNYHHSKVINPEMLSSLLLNINRFLIKCYCNKDEVKEDELNLFVVDLPTNLITKDQTIELINSSELDDIIKEELNKIKKH